MHIVILLLFPWFYSVLLREIRVDGTINMVNRGTIQQQYKHWDTRLVKRRGASSVIDCFLSLFLSLKESFFSFPPCLWWNWLEQREKRTSKNIVHIDGKLQWIKHNASQWHLAILFLDVARATLFLSWWTKTDDDKSTACRERARDITVSVLYCFATERKTTHVVQTPTNKRRWQIAEYFFSFFVFEDWILWTCSSWFVFSWIDSYNFDAIATSNSNASDLALSLPLVLSFFVMALMIFFFYYYCVLTGFWFYHLFSLSVEP